MDVKGGGGLGVDVKIELFLQLPFNNIKITTILTLNYANRNWYNFSDVSASH